MTTMTTTTLHPAARQFAADHLVLGCNVFGWTAQQEAANAVLDAFVAAGHRHLDTADMYSRGVSEQMISTWLRERGTREEVLIATKVAKHPDFPGLAPQNVRAACEASLQRLGTDRIDLYYAHFDDETQPVAQMAATFDALVREGKIGAVGLSNFSAARLREWFEVCAAEGYAVPAALQLHYHLAMRAEFEEELLPVVREHGPAVFTYFSLAAGFLTGKYRSAQDAEGVERSSYVSRFLHEDGFALVEQLTAVAEEHTAAPASVALAWLLAQEGVTAPIASARNLEQLPALLAGADLQLTAQDLARLEEASRPFAPQAPPVPSAGQPLGSFLSAGTRARTHDGESPRVCRPDGTCD